MNEEQKARLKEELAETRQELFTVVRGLDPHAWSQPLYPEDGRWTALDLLRHLTWAEGGMLRLVKQIREGGKGAPEDFDLDRYNETGVRKLKDKMPADLLHLMDDNRRELQELIDELAEDDWQKKGRHGSLGIATVEEIVHQVADHERQHTSDLKQALDRE